MIAHRALGMPSIDSTKQRISTVPLKASATFPTGEEIQANLSACYPSDDESMSQISGVVEGMQISVDELKISERLRWDPISNNILGVCREHGHRECSLVFQSQSQADALLECLKDKTVHLASEVRSLYTFNDSKILIVLYCRPQLLEHRYLAVIPTSTRQRPLLSPGHASAKLFLIRRSFYVVLGMRWS